MQWFQQFASNFLTFRLKITSVVIKQWTMNFPSKKWTKRRSHFAKERELRQVFLLSILQIVGRSRKYRLTNRKQTKVKKSGKVKEERVWIVREIKARGNLLRTLNVQARSRSRGRAWWRRRGSRGEWSWRGKLRQSGGKFVEGRGLVEREREKEYFSRIVSKGE